MKNSNKAYILLDRSGSMSTRWEGALASINAYVNNLKEVPVDVTVIAFDSDTHFGKTAVTDAYNNADMRYDVVRRNVNSQTWEPLTDAFGFTPRGMTPLYDAIVRLADDIKKENPKRAAIVIMTDGAENSSIVNNNETAKHALDRLRAKNYDVVFLGADFDNFEQARDLGNKFEFTVSAKGVNLEATMNLMGMRASSYYQTGVTASLSDAIRATATKE